MGFLTSSLTEIFWELVNAFLQLMAGGVVMVTAWWGDVTSVLPSPDTGFIPAIRTFADWVGIVDPFLNAELAIHMLGWYVYGLYAYLMWRVMLLIVTRGKSPPPHAPDNGGL